MGYAKYYEDNVEIIESRMMMHCCETTETQTYDYEMDSISTVSITSKKLKKQSNQSNRKPQLIICCECGKSFQFRGGEQRFYEKHHLCKPKRCPTCRNARNDWFRNTNADQ